MKRDLAQLDRHHFDMVIVGGGIYGAAAAWEASLRGLSVALIERDDFGSATSSNSLKIIHGGLRYIQHADFKRMRESIGERTTLMRIAPHLVHPLLCIMPTYGHALKGKEVLSVALMLNDIIGFDRNKGLTKDKRFPRGKVVSRKEIAHLIPGLDQQGLSGGALWYDAQIKNSERLIMAMLHAAVAHGAVIANYVEMTEFLTEPDRVVGIKARDMLTGNTLEISSKVTLNNSGPWFAKVLSNMKGHLKKPNLQLSAAMNLVVKKKLFPDYAVGLWSKAQFEDSDAILSKGSRLFFINPWHDYSIIGTEHVHYGGDPSDFRIKESDIQCFLHEVNEAYPPAQIKREDVTFFYGGLLPADTQRSQSGDVRLLKTYKLVDHKQESGIDGLITVVGVKYTTARDVAAKTIDFIVTQKLGIPDHKSQTHNTPVYGGDLPDITDFINRQKQTHAFGLPAAVFERLIANHGTAYTEVVKYFTDRPDLGQPVQPGEMTLRAEVIYAVREEMAVKLADVVRRRTELGSARNPGMDVLGQVAALMAEELLWDEKRIASEIAETNKMYEPAE